MKPIRSLDLATLTGTWHVVATTLSFWRGRRDPIIRYEPEADGRWRDTVAYSTAKGSQKQIVGFDTPSADVPGAFVWRGAGWLAWCSSRWCFLDADAGEGWALTWFSSATLRVTPEGFDVYSRTPDMSPKKAREIIEHATRASGGPVGTGWFLTDHGRPGAGEALR